MAPSAPAFAEIATNFKQAREYFRSLQQDDRSQPTEKWLLGQKERLMARFAAHWQFLRKCHLYNVQPSHLVDSGFRMTFSCALLTKDLKRNRESIQSEIGKFIESCGLTYNVQPDDGDVLTYAITLG